MLEQKVKVLENKKKIILIELQVIGIALCHRSLF